MKKEVGAPIMIVSAIVALVAIIGVGWFLMNRSTQAALKPDTSIDLTKVPPPKGGPSGSRKFKGADMAPTIGAGSGPKTIETNSSKL